MERIRKGSDLPKKKVGVTKHPTKIFADQGRVRLGYSGIRIYSGKYSGFSAPGSRIAGMEIQLFRNENSSQTNAYSQHSNYSYSGLIPNERAPSYSKGHQLYILLSFDSVRALEIHGMARATSYIACALEMRSSNGRERP